MARPDTGQTVNMFSTVDNLEYSTKYTFGQFNVNGWHSTRNPYNNVFKLEVLKCMNVIVILCETHCLNDQTIEIENYTVYQHNRQPQGEVRLRWC